MTENETIEQPIHLPCLYTLREQMGAKLLNLRIKRGWKQGVVAERLGITAFRLSNYEIGKNSVPYDVLIGLCELYGVTMDYLFGRTASPTASDRVATEKE